MHKRSFWLGSATLAAIVAGSGALAQLQGIDPDWRMDRKEVMRRAAKATFIQCPVDELRTAVVTELPSGWWQTPRSVKWRKYTYQVRDQSNDSHEPLLWPRTYRLMA